MNRWKRPFVALPCMLILVALIGTTVFDGGMRPAPVAAQNCTAGSWQTTYYSNTTTFQGGPANFSCTQPSQLNMGLFWGPNPPIGGVSANNYSIRFSGTINFPTAGTYRFTSVFQDNARLLINGALTSINFFGVDITTAQTQFADFTVAVPNTTVAITLEMAKFTGDGQINLNWALGGGGGGGGTPTQVPGNPWTSEYFNNRTFTAPSIIGATIPAGPLAIDWQFAAPAGGVLADGFSSRFTRVVNFPTGGNVTFTARADDTVTVRVDGTPVTASAEYFIEQTYSGSINLTPGNHTITVDHTDIVAQAYIFVNWTGGGDTSGGGTGTGGTGGTVTSPTGVVGTVNTGVLNFRQGPSTGAQRISQLRRGEQYAVLGRNFDSTWAMLDVAGTRGWVFARYLTFSGDFSTVPITDGSDAAPAVGAVMQARPVGNMRIRACPGFNCARVGFIPWGEFVDVFGQSADHRWIKISYSTPSGPVVGWAFKIWFRRVNDLTVGLPSDLPVVQ